MDQKYLLGNNNDICCKEKAPVLWTKSNLSSMSMFNPFLGWYGFLIISISCVRFIWRCISHTRTQGTMVISHFVKLSLPFHPAQRQLFSTSSVFCINECSLRYHRWLFRKRYHGLALATPEKQSLCMELHPSRGQCSVLYRHDHKSST